MHGEITFSATFFVKKPPEGARRVYWPLLFRSRRYFLEPSKSSNRIPEPRRHLDAGASTTSETIISSKNTLTAIIPLLRVLSRSEDEATRKNVILNPFAPFDVLSDLENQFPELFVNNPALELYNFIKP